RVDAGVRGAGVRDGSVTVWVAGDEEDQGECRGDGLVEVLDRGVRGCHQRFPVARSSSTSGCIALSTRWRRFLSQMISLISVSTVFFSRVTLSFDEVRKRVWTRSKPA